MLLYVRNIVFVFIVRSFVALCVAFAVVVIVAGDFVGVLFGVVVAIVAGDLVGFVLWLWSLFYVRCMKIMKIILEDVFTFVVAHCPAVTNV